MHCLSVTLVVLLDSSQTVVDVYGLHPAAFLTAACPLPAGRPHVTFATSVSF